MKNEDYWLLQPCGEDDSAVIESMVEDQVEDWELSRSVSLADRVLALIDLRFSSDFPSNIKLYDFLNNTLSVLIVTSKVKKIWDSLNVRKIEYFPVRVYDHNGSLASDDYHIANVLDRQPVIDLKNSKYEMNSLNPGSIRRFSELRLDWII